MEYRNPLLNCNEIRSNSILNSVAEGNSTTGLSGSFLYLLQISQVLEISSTNYTISSSSCHNLDVLINCFNLFELQWQNCRCNQRSDHALFFEPITTGITTFSDMSGGQFPNLNAEVDGLYFYL